MDYKGSGVNIEAGDDFVEGIKKILGGGKESKELISGVGGFAALFAPDLSGIEEPVLVSGTDGVGTKLKIAFMSGVHDTVGIDLVAMCVNDIVTTGARPLFFLDYFAAGRLDRGRDLEVISGIRKGCDLAGCILVGGETAELPGFYGEGEYDLAGFAVGIADRKKLIDGGKASPGDICVGISSSGLHSNGFSLARKALFGERKLRHNGIYPPFTRPLYEILLTPTHIYASAVRELSRSVNVKAMAHITGGGIEGNLPRVLPDDLGATINKSSVQTHEIFDFIKGDLIEEEEMWRVFNMGIGFIVVVSGSELEAALGAIRSCGFNASAIGRLEKGIEGVVFE
ncbi:MAG: phosphoribosylformylglycinamidine cyclo-ligase [Deltaproteobacteria bacterium]|nr:phosphoribosylformylglycinamidine cyclo-ligase [Deltaproteobacteria bacterium]